jgi:hypothetical protein
LLKLIPVLAEELILKNWPSIDALHFFEHLDLRHISPSIKSQIVTTMWVVGPRRFGNLLRSLRSGTGVSAATFKGVHSSSTTGAQIMPQGYLASLDSHSPEDWLDVSLVHGKGSGLSTLICGIDQTKEFILEGDLNPTLSDWAVLFVVSKFARDESKRSLAELFNNLESVGSWQELAGRAPWIIRQGIQLNVEGHAYRDIAHLVASGKFGDLSDWRAAEERWSRHGLTPQDFILSDDIVSAAPDIARMGAPPLAGLSVSHGEIALDEMRALVATVVRMKNGYRQRQLLQALYFGAHNPSATALMETGEVIDCTMKLLQEASSTEAAILLGYIVDSPVNIYGDQRFLKFLDNFGRHNQFSSFRIFSSRNKEPVIASFNTDTSLRGLLPTIAAVIAQGIIDIDLLANSAFVPEDGDGAGIKVAVILLKITAGKWSLSELPAMAAFLSQEDVPATIILGVLQKSSTALNRQRLLSELAASNSLKPLYFEIVELLKVCMDGVPSPMSAPASRRELALPVLPSE